MCRCSSYETAGRCAGGVFLEGAEWTRGPDFGSPELNCCACGKQSICRDTPGWKNDYGATCAIYESEGHCKDGEFVEGHEYTSTEEFGSPWKHCCVCGKGGPAPPPPPPSPLPPSPPPPPENCQDTAGWKNPYGMDCEGYAVGGHCICVGGFLPENCGFAKGREWAKGPKFFNPEKNCCVCGKRVS